MITREELLKQETKHDKKVKEIEEKIDNELKKIEPDDIKNNIVEISIYINYISDNDSDNFLDDVLQKVFEKYKNNNGYKKITFETKEDGFINEKGFRYDIKLFI